MGFIREHAAIMAIFLTVFVLGYVWHARGKLDAGQAFQQTYNYVEPRKEKIDAIAARHDTASGVTQRWLRGTY